MKKVSLLLIWCVSFLSFSQNVTDAKGMKQGAWSKTYPNSSDLQYKGQFKNNKPVGTFTYFYPSSKVKAIIKHSASNNRSEAFYYHENTNLMSYGIFRDLKKDSIWLNFTESGKLSNAESYKNDLLNGKKTIYFVSEIESGKSPLVSATCMYAEGKANGEYIEYFNDGNIKLKGNYLLDKKNGIWESNHSNGKRMAQERYKNGMRHGWSYGFDASGVLLGKEYYFQGNKLEGKELEAKLAALKQKGIDPND
jgi:antitoxin component YwqK of YwqJK toxin-antitoxin module